MRAKKIFLAALAAIIIFGIQVQAQVSEKMPSDGMQNTETKAEEEIKYGEMKDGLFVNELWEDLEKIPYSQDDERFFAESEKVLQARRLEQLTPEMEAAGYQLDAMGNVLPPGGGQGELSEEQAARMRAEEAAASMQKEEVKYGFLSIDAEVEKSIHEKCFISIEGTDNELFFTYNLYETNGYATQVQIPAGNYRIFDGGIDADYTQGYPLKSETQTFTVPENSTCILNITIGEVETEESPGPVPAVGPTDSTKPADTLKNKHTGTLITIVLATAIMAVAAVIVRKRKEN